LSLSDVHQSLEKAAQHVRLEARSERLTVRHSTQYRQSHYNAKNLILISIRISF
jgi:hypothetical protein